MEAPRTSPGSRHALPRRHILYEFERAQAGNPLFCPAAPDRHLPQRGLPPLYEDAAHLLKLLAAGGFDPGLDFHSAIALAAGVLCDAVSSHAKGNDCAEYLLYCLQGVPNPQTQKREAKLRAIIGTFYANLQIALALDRK